MIRIALPNKGRLAEATRSVLERAGLPLAFRADRALQARLGDDFLALFLRAADIPEFVADRAADLGITGRDRVAESGRGRELDELLDLGFGRCRLVVAAREDGIASVAQIPEGAPVATSFPGVARRFFESAGKRVTMVPVSGAAEIAPHLGVADVIVDLVSTGSTLKTNGLVEIATVMESSAVLVGRTGVLEGKGQAEKLARETSQLVDALESVIRARDKRYLMANVPRQRLAEVRDILPGLAGPTVVDILDDGDKVATHAVIDQRDTYRLISALRDVGATGILITKIERLAP